jgi:hypothetical protein
MEGRGSMMIFESITKKDHKHLEKLRATRRVK